MTDTTSGRDLIGPPRPIARHEAVRLDGRTFPARVLTDPLDDVSRVFLHEARGLGLGASLQVRRWMAELRKRRGATGR